MAASPPIPRPADKGDHGRDLIILLWVLTGVTLVVVSLRAFAAIRRRKIALDDWLMFVAMLCFIAWSICGTLMATKGGVGHVYYLVIKGPEAVSEVVKINWITQVWGIAGVTIGKISVAFLILRVMGKAAGRANKYGLYAVIIATIIIDSLAAIFTFVQCDPPRKLWHPKIHGSCWNPDVMADYAVFTGVFNGLIDIALALFPAAAVFLKLEAPRRVKLELCALFSGGIFAGICSFVKSKQLLSLSNRSDFSWATYSIFIWVTLELFLVISLGSVPSLRQLGPRTRPTRIGATYVSPNDITARLGYGVQSEIAPVETQTVDTKISTDFTSSSSDSEPHKAGGSSYEVENRSESDQEDGRRLT